MIKNHPFHKGSRHAAVATPLVFLSVNGKWLKIDEQQHYAFAKWVAESLPAAKDVALRAIVDFLDKQLVVI